MNMQTLSQIAVIGGTGKEGSGLAFRWASAGYPVVIGSRSSDRARTAATELNRLLGAELISGLSNEAAARQGEIVVVTVPYSAHIETLRSIQAEVAGKIVVDVTVPISPPVTVVSIPPGLSAAQEAQTLLGDGVRVVSAFQNVSAVHLKDLSRPVMCDVLVTGDDPSAKDAVIALARAAGMRGIDAGPLANAVAAESLTPVLLAINKRYGVKGTGIMITEFEPERT